MLRLFTAIKIFPGTKLKEALDDFRSELEYENIKWVHPSNIHITLKFFGDTSQKDVPLIIENLTRASGRSKAFQLSVKGCGTFGSARFPRVIWLGLVHNAEIINLYNNINKNLSDVGYEPDKRGFSPHLTIGRVKHIKDLYTLDALISKYSDEVFMTCDVKEFHLFQSILHRDGPQYHILNTFNLQDA